MQRRRHGIDEYRQRLRYFLDLSGLTRKAGERLPYKTAREALDLSAESSHTKKLYAVEQLVSQFSP